MLRMALVEVQSAGCMYLDGRELWRAGVVGSRTAFKPQARDLRLGVVLL